MQKSKNPIYLDHHATTPVDPRVLEVMLPCFGQEFGNPSSGIHLFGLRAQAQMDHARPQVAGLVGAQPKEIIFTSGSTESNNLAIKGLFDIYGKDKPHIVTQVTEHKSVLDVCKFLERKGAKVTYLPVDPTGKISPEALRRSITDKTLLISIMFANNEIGTVQPIAEIGKTAKAHGVFFHTDASQAAGRIPIDVHKMGIDLLSFSGHKMYGPKGVGALFVRHANPRVRLSPLFHGGGQEDGLRSGTYNVPGIVGFATACGIAAKEMSEESVRLGRLRTRLQSGIEEELSGVFLNGHPVDRLANNLNLSFEGVDGESLLTTLNQDLAVSAGSACISAQAEPSYVLKALGIPEERIHTSVRFGLGRFNTKEEIDYAIKRVVAAVKKLRQINRLSLLREVRHGRSFNSSGN